MIFLKREGLDQSIGLSLGRLKSKCWCFPQKKEELEGNKIDHKNTPSLASSCGARVVFTTSETFVYNILTLINKPTKCFFGRKEVP